MHPKGPPLSASGAEADLLTIGVQPKSPPPRPGDAAGVQIQEDFSTFGCKAQSTHAGAEELGTGLYGTFDLHPLLTLSSDSRSSYCNLTS